MRAEAHLGVHAVSIMASDFNQNWNIPTNFTEVLEYEISLKSVHQFPNSYTTKLLTAIL
jgi:hypothetical protein